MNALADPFKQLMERKLWPVALLLVAALVAVPFLLASDEPAAPPPVAAAPAGQGATEPVVSLADAARRDEVRAVLGARKDPFRPAQVLAVPTPEPQPSVGAGAASAGATSGGDVGASGGDVGSTGGTTVDPSPPAEPTPAPTQPPTVDEPEAPKPTFDLYSLQVRFGDVGTGELRTRNVKRLTSLPNGISPAALYLGLSEDKQSAVFLVDAGVDVVGDGRCVPAPSNCETLVLEPGETVFLTRGERQFQLDLIAINTRKTTDEAEARRSRTEVAVGGRAALRRMQSATRYRYSQASGTVRELAPPRRGLQHQRSADFTAAG